MKLYSMKEVCELTGFSYETLKFYCNKGLVPHLKRSPGGQRMFDERDIAWIKDLHCLRNCRMSIREMKQYLDWCMEGPASLPVRQEFLSQKKEELEQEMRDLQESIRYIEWKKELYTSFQNGTVPYRSNLIRPEDEEDEQE